MSRAHSPRVCRELLLLVPSWLQHIPALSLFVRSMLVHVADLGSASLRIVLGDDLVSRYALERALSYPSLPVLQGGQRSGRASDRLEVGIVTLDEVLALHNLSYAFVPNDERCIKEVHRKCAFDPRGVYGARASENKFLYQFIKKMYGVLYFHGYREAVILDSEGLVLGGPVSLRALVRAHGGGSGGDGSSGDGSMDGAPPHSQLVFSSHQQEPFMGGVSATSKYDPLKLRRMSEACRYLLGLPSALSIARRRADDCGFAGMSEAKCRARGCVWDPPSRIQEQAGQPWCRLPGKQFGQQSGRPFGQQQHAAATDPVPWNATARWSLSRLGQPHAVAWGYQGWVWRRSTVVSLFSRVQRAHGGTSLLAAASRIFEHDRCYEATLYWEHVANPPTEEEEEGRAVGGEQKDAAETVAATAPHAGRGSDAGRGSARRGERRSLDVAVDREEVELRLHTEAVAARKRSSSSSSSSSYSERMVGAEGRARAPPVASAGGRWGPGGGSSHRLNLPDRTSSHAPMRIISPASLIHFLNGTCVYLPVWPTRLEFFSAFLIVPQVSVQPLAPSACPLPLGCRLRSHSRLDAS